MIENPFYGRETQGEFRLYELGNLVLESGETLRGAKLAYRTFGKLNAEKSNAILVTTWFSGTGKVMEDVYVGQSHALDPDRYFIVIVDQLGSGVSSSPIMTSSAPRRPPTRSCRWPSIGVRSRSLQRRPWACAT